MSKKDNDKIIYTIHDCLDFYYVYTRYMYGYILPQEMLIEVFPKTEESKLKKYLKNGLMYI